MSVLQMWKVQGGYLPCQVPTLSKVEERRFEPALYDVTAFPVSLKEWVRDKLY